MGEIFFFFFLYLERRNQRRFRRMLFSKILFFFFSNWEGIGDCECRILCFFLYFFCGYIYRRGNVKDILFCCEGFRIFFFSLQIPFEMKGMSGKKKKENI